MSIHTWNPLNNADQYRDNAQRFRDNGKGSTCKVYPTTAAMERAKGAHEESAVSQFVAELKCRWANAIDEARCQYDWDTRLSHIIGGDNAF